MGLPLQLFGKGALFGPYTPLQQLDVLADFGTKSYIVGSTNSLLLQQKDRYSDILINVSPRISWPWTRAHISSLMIPLSASPRHLSATLSISQPPIGAGSTSYRRPWPTPGMKTTLPVPRRWDTWAQRTSLDQVPHLPYQLFEPPASRHCRR